MPEQVPRPDLSRLRVEYSQRSLSDREVDADPIRQFTQWLDEAVTAEVHEPNAMTLATSTKSGVPSARVVLLKGISHDGFTFYTNYASRKGRELDENPRAALVFYWPEVQRQVRVEGTVSRASEAESDEYFSSRPPEAQIGAAASPQSEVVESRQVLEETAKKLWDRFPSGQVPRPPHWGGYRLHPTRIEFWQGRPGRLHDRIGYLRTSGSHWTIKRLAP